MRVLEAPSPILTALLDDEVERLGHPLVPRDPGTPQILQRPQDIIVVAVWERELGIGRIDDLAGRKPAEEAPLEEVFLPPFTGRRQGWRAVRRSLVLGKALEHVDRRMERAARRSVLLLAVPSAVVHLLPEQPVHEAPALRILPEVRADRDNSAINAGL